MRWIKLWTEEIVRGTTFTELSARDRGIWFSLLALAGIEGNGLIYARIGVGYSNLALAEIVNVGPDELAGSLTVLLQHNKIKIVPENVIEIINWVKYQDEYHRQKPYRIAKQLLYTKQTQLQTELQVGLINKLPADKDKDKEEDKDKNNKGGCKGGGRFVKPTPEEVTAYAKTLGFELEGEYFCSFYESKGWMIGKNKMKCWKSAVVTWKTRYRGGTNGHNIGTKMGSTGTSAVKAVEPGKYSGV